MMSRRLLVASAGAKSHKVKRLGQFQWMQRIHLSQSSNNSRGYQLTYPSKLPPFEKLPWRSQLRILAPRAALAIGWIYLFQHYGVDVIACEGPSMYPTFFPIGEIVLVEKFWWCQTLQGGPQGAVRARLARQAQDEADTNDVWHEPRISVSHISRISWRQAFRHFFSPLAVGDVVAAWHPHHARQVMVCKRILGLPGDQVLLTEEQRLRWRLPQQLLVIPDGHVWLEGDNPLNSSDSRDYGPIPVATLVGRVILRVWPLRGNAWTVRGEPPVHSKTYGMESTILPAGYKGESIVKDSKSSKRQ